MGDGKVDTLKTCGVAEDKIALAAVSGFSAFPFLSDCTRKKLAKDFFNVIDAPFQAILFILYILYTGY